MLPNDYWDKKHLEYSSKNWINKPTIFAKFAVKYFPTRGKFLELGCGQGQDSRYFSKLGYKVTATDFSSKALALLKGKSKNEGLKIETQIVDLKDKLPYKDNSFDVVYSHLSLHYFDYQTTKILFSEIARVLKKNGVFATILNTINDPEIINFEKVEDYYFREPNKILKRYFSTEYLSEFVNSNFEYLVLDAKGETHKDEIKTLIRFVGKKI